MNIQKLTFIIILSVFLFSCNKDTPQEVQTESQNKSISQETQTTIVQNSENIDSSSQKLYGEMRELETLFPTIEKEKLTLLQAAIQEDDFIAAQKIIPSILEDIKKDKNIDKNVIQALQYHYISSMLNEGTYLYKEDEKSKQAIEYIDTVILKDPDFVDPFYSNYYLWYAQEIVKNYKLALEYYNKALDFAWNLEKNKKLKAVILNQVGHVHDLSGDLDTAYKFYQQSYEVYNQNPENILNLWRYYVRKNDLKNAKIYFEKALGFTQVKLLKSEIYYNLSSLYLYDMENQKRLEISLSNAEKSIELNPKSPLWYLWKSRVYILKWEKLEEAEALLKKAISLHPNFSTAYEWLGLLQQGKWIYSKSIEYFLTSMEMIPNDIILMNHEKNSNLARVNYLLSVSLALWKNKEMAIHHLQQMLIIKDDISLSMFISEIKKENYWVFHELKWTKEFEEIVSVFKK